MPLFISCDWGTSNFRLRFVDRATRRILAESHSESGIAIIHQQWQQSDGQHSNPPESTRLPFYASFLLRQIRALSAQSAIDSSGLLLIISGMASSSLGMTELPYKQLPAAGKDLITTTIPASDHFPHDILLASGIRTDQDVIRGEETQLTGCLADRRETSGLYIFPGTHSKHIHVEDGIIQGFTTYMTGEFFHLLSQKSILSAAVLPNHDHHRQSFTKGIADSQHASLLHSPFLVRTNSLFDRLSKEENYHYLSGLLIGEELKDIAKSAMPVTLVSSGSQKDYYRLACELLHIPLTAIMDADEALVRGHCQFYPR